MEEEFAVGNSIFHRLDPRVKIVAAATFSIVVAVSTHARSLCVALFAAFIMLAFARLDFRAACRRLLIVNGFIFFLWLLIPFTFPGEALFSIGPLIATVEGINYSLMVTLKSNAIIIASVALLSTSTVFDLTHALSHAYVPEKLIHVFFFCFRYMHVLQMERARLLNAMKVRCFTPRTDLHTYRTYSWLVGMLLVNSYDRAERVYDAMKCRGFKGKYYVLDHFHLHATDVVVAIALFSVVALLILLELVL